METDAIKQLVDYATSQGSKNANHYYSLITKETNKTLAYMGHVDKTIKKNVKDHLDFIGLADIKQLEIRASKAIIHGINEGMYYKDIYKYVKEEVKKLADSLRFNPKQLK
ncbi:MAG: hypothetical protein ACLFVR_16620 [Thiohalospira sp.]